MLDFRTAVIVITVFWGHTVPLIFAKNYIAATYDDLPGIVQHEYNEEHGYLFHKAKVFKRSFYDTGVVTNKIDKPLQLAFLFDNVEIHEIIQSTNVHLTLRGQNEEFHLRFFFPFVDAAYNHPDHKYALVRPKSYLVLNRLLFEFRIEGDEIVWLPELQRQRIPALAKRPGIIVANNAHGFSYSIYGDKIKFLKFGVKLDDSMLAGFAFPDLFQPIDPMWEPDYSEEVTTADDEESDEIISSTNGTTTDEAVAKAGFNFKKHWVFLVIGTLIVLIILMILILVTYKCYRSSVDEENVRAQRHRIRMIMRQNNAASTPKAVASQTSVASRANTKSSGVSQATRKEK